MDNNAPFDTYETKPRNDQPARNFAFLDNHMLWVVILVTALLLVGLYLGVWYLGYTRATVKSQTTISQLRVENTQLANDAAAWKKKALSAGLISAEEAKKILLADYAEESSIVTLIYPYTDCERFASSRQIDDWNVPFTEKAFTMKWNGTVTAGIDLNRVSIKVDKSGEKLIVSIPRAEVFDVQIDKESFELLDEQNNIFNPISMEDLLKLDIKIGEDMEARALENGLLTAAQQNARVYVTDILRSSEEIGSYYEIEFKLK